MDEQNQLFIYFGAAIIRRVDKREDIYNYKKLAKKRALSNFLTGYLGGVLSTICGWCDKWFVAFKIFQDPRILSHENSATYFQIQSGWQFSAQSLFSPAYYEVESGTMIKSRHLLRLYELKPCAFTYQYTDDMCIYSRKIHRYIANSNTIKKYKQ